ncbi:MAG: hypothetical protein ACIRZ5_01805 [Ligilactobacillus ruminis]
MNPKETPPSSTDIILTPKTVFAQIYFQFGEFKFAVPLAKAFIFELE